METATLVQQVQQIIVAAADASVVRLGLAGQMVELGRRARSADEFASACREAEKVWREQSGETRLPQPYANAKSVVKFAMKNGIALASRGKSVTFNALREAVKERRAEGKEPAPEREQLAEAIDRARKTGNPLVLVAAAQQINALVDSFERAKAPPAIQPAVLSGRRAERVAAAAH
jgi:hypothetical protein